MVKFFMETTESTFPTVCFNSRLSFVNSDHTAYKDGQYLLKSIVHASFVTLVAFHGAMTIEDTVELIPELWKQLESCSRKYYFRIAFLFMYCSERNPALARKVMFQDLYNNNMRVRATSLRKVAALFMERRVIAMQNLPFDNPLSLPLLRQGQWEPRMMYNSFKGSQIQPPYVIPDFGTEDLLAVNEPEWLVKLKEAARQIRRNNNNLMSLGKKTENTNQGANVLDFEANEEAKERERRRRVETMLMLLPSGSNGENPGKRDGRRHRAVYPAVFGLISYALVDLLFDEHADVFNLSRETLTNMLRDDPTLFLRAFLNELPTAPLTRQLELFTRLSRLLTSRRALPPGFSYLLFNYLLGLMRYCAQQESENGFEIMAQSLPLLGELIAAVQGLEFRDFKKGRIELFLFTSGRFWYSEGAPSFMFPHDATQLIKAAAHALHPALNVPTPYLKLAMMRTSQAHLMTQFILRYPGEVNGMRRLLGMELQKAIAVSSGRIGDCREQIELLWSGDASLVDDVDFSSPLTSTEEDTLSLISLFKRIWINYLDVLYTFVNRSYNDYEELQLVLKEVGDVLLHFRHDYGIVRQILSLYVNLATRLKTFFIKTGYSIITPILHRLFMVLCEEGSRYNKLRNGVLYTWRRFFVLHQESFVFQALGNLVPIIAEKAELSTDSRLRPEVKALLELMDVLEHSMDVDMLGVHLSAIQPDTHLIELNEDAVFTYEDLLLFTATVILHDPTTLRAEQFLKFARMFVPAPGYKRLFGTFWVP